MNGSLGFARPVDKLIPALREAVAEVAPTRDTSDEAIRNGDATRIMPREASLVRSEALEEASRCTEAARRAAEAARDDAAASALAAEASASGAAGAVDKAQLAGWEGAQLATVQQGLMAAEALRSVGYNCTVSPAAGGSTVLTGPAHLLAPHAQLLQLPQPPAEMQPVALPLEARASSGSTVTTLASYTEGDARRREVITLCIEGDYSAFDDARMLKLRKALAGLLACELELSQVTIRKVKVADKVAAKIGTGCCRLRIEVDQKGLVGYEDDMDSGTESSSAAGSSTSTEDLIERDVEHLTHSRHWPKTAEVADIEVVWKGEG